MIFFFTPVRLTDTAGIWIQVGPRAAPQGVEVVPCCHGRGRLGSHGRLLPLGRAVWGHGRSWKQGSGWGQRQVRVGVRVHLVGKQPTPSSLFTNLSGTEGEKCWVLSLLSSGPLFCKNILYTLFLSIM